MKTVEKTMDTTTISRAENRMKDLDISPAEFSRQMDELPQTYNNWKKRGNIPGNKLFKAASVLKCNPKWLADGSGNVADIGSINDSGLNKAAAEDAITVIKFIENKTGSELSVAEWSELFTHFYDKYDKAYRSSETVDKAELMLDFYALMEKLKNQPIIPTNKNIDKDDSD